MTATARWQRFFPLALFVAFTLVSIAPIRNYDFFWHLATGRWIVEHHALPEVDPFAVASARHAWINGEWLFQVVLHALHWLTGLAALSFVRAALAGLLFAGACALAARRSSPEAALVATALGFAGAAQTFDLRPASVAPLLLVAALAILDSDRKERSLWYVLLTAVWINVHPSALLAPLLALLIRPRTLIPWLSGAALFLNPFGWKAIFAPLQLLLFASGGTFVNAEWLPSHPRVFPLLYVAIAAALAAWAVSPEWRNNLGRLAVFALLAWLAARHVRHQPLFFAAYPLLAAPAFRFASKWRPLGIVTIALSLMVTAIRTDHRLGVAPERFPVTAVSRLRETGLQGNIYNPDQFGGILIWTFYPERRALTDGRNELYAAFIPEFARARGDERAWQSLLRKYRIDLAVDEYRRPLQVIEAGTGRARYEPASLAFWPRTEWALIGYDAAGMVFARRAAFRPEVLARHEIRGVVPDAPRRRPAP